MDMQSAGSRRPKVSEHWHQFACLRMIVENSMLLAVDTPIDGMHNAVASPGIRALKKRRRKQRLSGPSEGDINRVVHTTGEHRLKIASIWPGPKQM